MVREICTWEHFCVSLTSKQIDFLVDFKMVVYGFGPKKGFWVLRLGWANVTSDIN